MKKKGERKGARQRTRKTLILVPTLWYSLVAFQSTVGNFMTSSGCSMEGALPKKESVPTVLGVARF